MKEIKDGLDWNLSWASKNTPHLTPSETRMLTADLWKFPEISRWLWDVYRNTNDPEIKKVAKPVIKAFDSALNSARDTVNWKGVA